MKLVTDKFAIAAALQEIGTLLELKGGEYFSVDAHSTAAMNNLKFGVGIARRGWVKRNKVLNALGVKAFQKAVRPV